MPPFALNKQYTWYHVFMFIWQWIRKLLSWIGKLFWILAFLFFAARSSVSLGDPLGQVRRYTRQDEFEFVGWTLNALFVKVGEFSLGVPSRLQEEDRVNLVLDYFEDLRQARLLEQELEILLADPAGSEENGDAQSIRSSLFKLRADLHQIQPVVETILQEQVAYILTESGLGAGGKIFPPVSFKFTKLPLALIVSPRDVIRVEANVQLDPSLTLDERIELEEQVAADLDVSSLVVNIGGIGIYPTMILESTSLRWVVETIVHEWVHNYLFLRPLGLNYETSAELRTMNETVASLLGEELGYRVLLQYYPAFAPERDVAPSVSPPPTSEPPAFDFRAEMHETRIKVDEFLAQGLVEEAETYMEERRQFFWDNGYRIRKLNQAYFAFHGAYADTPKGPAGEDPVGDAVRQFWEMTDSPMEFLFRMSWMNEFSDLEKTLQAYSTTP